MQHLDQTPCYYFLYIIYNTNDILVVNIALWMLLSRSKERGKIVKI